MLRRIWRALATGARTLALAPLRAIGDGLSWIARPLARGIAGAALILAAVAFAHDLGPSLIARRVEVKPTTVIIHWQQLAPVSYKATRSFLTQRAQPVWDTTAAVLSLPAFAWCVAIALVMGHLGRRRDQVDIFAN